MNINLEYYKIFYYVARQGSVTAAAAELSVSQPAVSQAIKALEHAVGIPLFVRTGKGVRLTPAGEILYSYVLTVFPRRSSILIIEESSLTTIWQASV